MNLSPDSRIAIDYAAIRACVPQPMSIAVLHIGAQQTLLASGDGSEPSANIALEIGSQRTSAEFFQHSPPTPLELENAIMTVEDEVARARTAIANGSTLFSCDAAVHAIALFAGLADQPVVTLSLATMERTFERLTAVSLGRPAAHEGLPTDAAFAATLLILREAMHHMNFSSITAIR
jgi:exopolyphosphatase/pppGpp-phosphohydrolase